MEVTEVRVFLADEDDERLKAYATVTFDNSFVVRDLKIIQGNTGLFVAMPSKKRKDGTYKDVAHPIHSGFRESLEQVILKKYESETGSGREDRAVEKSDSPIKRVHTGGDEALDSANYNSIQDIEAGIAPVKN